MYTLFNEPSGLNLKQIKSVKFEYIKRGHRMNLDRVISHYRSANHAVKSNHLLVRLIHSLPGIGNDDIHRYMERMEFATNELAQSFRLTSPVSVGKSIYPGVFYGTDSEEIIIVNNEEFDVSEAIVNWEELEPVRFLRHPKTDLNLEIPMGTSTSEEKGPTVTTINLPMLALQYYYWRKNEEETREVQRTVMQYVAGYVLPNMLKSQMDLAYLNIFIKTVNGEIVPQTKESHPFYLNSRYHETLEGVNEIIYKQIKRKLSFVEILEGVDGLVSKKLRDAIVLPRIPMTRQVIWALVITRLPIINFLLVWHETAESFKNAVYINRVKRNLLQLRSDRTLEQMTSSKMTDEIKTFINKEIIPLIR